MAEVTLPAPIKATHLPNDADFYGEYGCGKVPGSFRYDGKIFRFCCPCGCGSVGPLRAGIGHKPSESPSWQFNGNYEAPTLYPSVHDVGHWHGWLRDGLWVQA
ncbi:DUF6527 family protein [Taklimakanibacter deserti]|uniref:DUF6527 family protein n=1 Tax=Taklimakanibacter deserti TaxID=2267839 RepID=UPI000E646623